MSKCLLAILFLCSFFKISYCQSGGANETSALQHARQLYVNSLSQQAGIYSGPDYLGYPHPVKDGHPFFLSAEPFKGEIYYDGIQYKDIPMWYDLAKNEVIIQRYDNFSRISLHPERIRDFSISGHHYIKIDEAASERTGLAKGFYDQLYHKKSEVLVRRSKDFLINTNIDGVWVSFSNEKNAVFIRTGTEYKQVSSQKSVLQALGKYQKEIQADLKQTKIRFNKEREKAITIMVAYYDELNNQL